MIQIPHSVVGYDMTPNVIAQISTKVTMTVRFLGFVGSLSSSEQQLWFPNQNVQEDFNCDIQEFITVQDFDGKTDLITGLLTGKQVWKYPVSLLVTSCGSKSLKVILIDSDFRDYPVLNPLVTL
jgi:hypothetical protein